MVVVRRRPPKGCLRLVVVEAEELDISKNTNLSGTTSLDRRSYKLRRRSATTNNIQTLDRHRRNNQFGNN